VSKYNIAYHTNDLDWQRSLLHKKNQ